MGAKTSEAGVVTAVRTGLRVRADPTRAPAMAQYMKDKQPFLGVPAPAVQALAKDAARAHRPGGWDEAEAALRELYAGEYREERYAAIALARAWTRFQTPEALPLYEWMVTEGAWWDLVDGIATNLVGQVALRYPDCRPRVFGYVASPDLWLRRTALLAQHKWKAQTDWPQLQALIEATAHEEDFFIRKAIGWALREYGKTDPDAVVAFVDAMGDRLSSLSRREAMKRLAG